MQTEEIRNTLGVNNPQGLIVMITNAGKNIGYTDYNIVVDFWRQTGPYLTSNICNEVGWNTIVL